MHFQEKNVVLYSGQYGIRKRWKLFSVQSSFKLNIILNKSTIKYLKNKWI